MRMKLTDKGEMRKLGNLVFFHEWHQLYRLEFAGLMKDDAKIDEMFIFHHDFCQLLRKDIDGY